MFGFKKWFWYEIVPPALLFSAIILMLIAIALLVFRFEILEDVDTGVIYGISLLLFALSFIFYILFTPWFLASDPRYSHSISPVATHRKFFLIAASIGVAFLIVTAALAYDYFEHPIDDSGLRPAIVCAMVGIGFLALSYWHSWMIRRRMMRTCRVASVCFLCNYDMRVTPQGPCPECGYMPPAIA